MSGRASPRRTLLLGGASHDADDRHTPAAADLRATSASAAARTATLDKRSADLDGRSVALDRRDAAVSATEGAKRASTFGDGQQVGVGIMPGTYHTDGESGCYWEKSTGGEGIDGIIDNDNVSGPVTLVIEPSVKFFKSADCGTWTKR